MKALEKVELLLQQAAELPEEAKADLVRSLVEMWSQDLGIFHVDEDERVALARSAENIQLGRFASDEEVETVFTRYDA